MNVKDLIHKLLELPDNCQIVIMEDHIIAIPCEEVSENFIFADIENAVVLHVNADV